MFGFCCEVVRLIVFLIYLEGNIGVGLRVKEKIFWGGGRRYMIRDYYCLGCYGERGFILGRGFIGVVSKVFFVYGILDVGRFRFLIDSYEYSVEIGLLLKVGSTLEKCV